MSFVTQHSRQLRNPSWIGRGFFGALKSINVKKKSLVGRPWSPPIQQPSPVVCLCVFMHVRTFILKAPGNTVFLDGEVLFSCCGIHGLSQTSSFSLSLCNVLLESSVPVSVTVSCGSEFRGVIRMLALCHRRGGTTFVWPD